MKNIGKSIIAVIWAMFGVRSSKGWDKDKKISIPAIIVVGFSMLFIFIGLLIAIIKFVVLK